MQQYLGHTLNCIEGTKGKNFNQSSHWDNFERPFSEGPRDLRDVFGDPGNLDLWVKEAKQVSPRSSIVVMKFFESYAP